MIGMAKGMARTFNRLLHPSINQRYPLQKKVLPERARMGFRMDTDGEGAPRCKACMLCERSCPVRAIEKTGRILTAECFQCLDCQVEYYDDKRCPSLVQAARRRDDGVRTVPQVAEGGAPVAAMVKNG